MLCLCKSRGRGNWNLEWSSYIGDFERWMKERFRNGASPWGGTPWRGPWGRAPLLGTPKDMLNKAQKWASASTRVPLLGNVERRFFLRAFLFRLIFMWFSRNMQISCKWVQWRTEGDLGGSNPPPRNSEVLTKLSRIPSSVENTSAAV
jgi:hypothetical protein